jgi:hypothetical protein
MSENFQYARGLRELADFLDSHPDLPIFNCPDVATHIWNRKDFLNAVRAMGGAKKDYAGDYFKLVKTFTGGVTLRIQCERQTVCERVVTGEEEIEVFDLTAPKIKVKREKYEWRCDPLALLEVPE